MAFSPIHWTGDLDDDCIARWCGLTLRAECMGCNDDDCDGLDTCKPEHGEYWWWEVSARRDGEWITFAGSNGEGVLDNGKSGGASSGQAARVAAENAVRTAIRIRDWFAGAKERANGEYGD